MELLDNPFTNIRLRHKIALLCIVLVLVSSSFAGILLYRNAAVVTTESEAVHAAEVIAQVNNYLNEKLKGIIVRVLSLRRDGMFNETVERFLIDGDPRYEASALSYFSNVFLEMRYSDPFIASMYLFTPKGSFYDLSLPYNAGVQFTDTKLYRQVMEMPPASVYWLPRSESELYRLDDSVISFVVRFSIRGYSEELFMVVHLSEQNVLEYLQGIYSGDGSATFIIDDESGVIVVGDPPVIDQMSKDLDVWKIILEGERGSVVKAYGGDSYRINHVQMNVAPWTLVNMQSQRSLLNKLDNMQMYWIVVLLISITLSLILAIMLASTISKPLQSLERQMQKVRLGDFSARFEYRHKDEVGNLGRSFNYMAEAIEDLIQQKNHYIEQLEREKDQVQNEQRLKRIAELKALQSQMTPHFLYNTLDSIKWKAEIEEQQEIADMITALATFFRISLSRGKEIITVKEELDHVASYLAIQKMRYKDRFTYEIVFDPQIKHLPTLKFILQPLVENAIYHGIKQMSEPGFIRISAERSGDSLKFTVTDNGSGIHPIKLKLITKQLRAIQQEPKDGYGLYNVNDRIKLYYGKKYGLQMTSELGGGTEVTAHIPITEDEGSPHNV